MGKLLDKIRLANLTDKTSSLLAICDNRLLVYADLLPGYCKTLEANQYSFIILLDPEKILSAERVIATMETSAAVS
jgi:hypothetical protein